MDDLSGLGPYADLIDSLAPAGGESVSAAVLKDRVANALAVPFPDAVPQLEQGATGVRDGVAITRVSWQLPYGPRTEGLLLHPATGDGPWPGLIACHDHGGFRWIGHEKIADGLDGSPAVLTERGALRPSYGGRPIANDLAAAGFCVLCHDVFSWGSRRFPGENLGESAFASLPMPQAGRAPSAAEVDGYNTAANQREHTIAKWCAVSGVQLSGLIAFEDRAALSVLLGVGACNGWAAALGHSGGAARAACLAATDERLQAAVCSCLVSTWPEIMRHRSWLHSWQLWISGLGTGVDWSDLVAVRVPMPLWVHFGIADGGFSRAGMQQADERIRARYSACGANDRYHGSFKPVGHQLLPENLQEIIGWLANEAALQA